MDVIRLNPVTKKGKQLVKEHGNLWRIIRHQKSVPCLNNSSGIFIEAVDTLYQRWIQDDGSPHFQRE
jgi:hypothetical protein